MFLLKFLIIYLVIGNTFSFENDLEDVEDSEILLSNQIDEYTDALLFLNSTNIRRLILSLRNIECINCKFTDTANITIGRNISIRLSTTYPSFVIKIRKADSDEVFCEINPILFTERGVYQLNIDNRTCKLKVIEETDFIYWPVIISSIVLASSAILYIILRFVFRKYCKAKYVQVTQTCTECDITVTETNPETNESTINSHQNEEMNVYKTVYSSENNSQNNLSKLNQASRLRFIDTFRGICLAIMIFVNYGAGNYSLFSHALWNGLLIPDLIFPSFIFIMGTSIALSMQKTVVQEITQNVNSGEMGRFNKKLISSVLFKIVRRTILLFFFGLLTSNSSQASLKDLRIMGVLQRFSISYFVCALLELVYLIINNFSYHEVTCFDADYNRRMKIFYINFKEIIYYYYQWLVVIMLSFIWIMITFLMPVPGCPTGYIGPGGLHNNGQYENCTGGAAGYIDRIILGQSHLYPYLPFRLIYQAKLEFDSEGLLGSLTSCVLTYLGVTAGHILIHYKDARQRIIRFLVYGVVFGLIAAILCNWSKEDGWIPINKNLWSISFILLVASICFLMYIFLYLLIDRLGWFSGKPFLFLGKNSICIYISHIVFANYFPVQFYTTPTHTNSIIMHIYGVILWSSVAWFLYEKKIFMKI